MVTNTGIGSSMQSGFMDHMVTQRRLLCSLIGVLVWSVLPGCGSGGDSEGVTAVNSSAPPTAPGSGNRPPTISGTPPAGVVGQAYSFTPVASDPDGNTLAFTIQNRPTWLNFSTVTGALTGTPTAAGSFPNISITVSDGQASATLGPFTITVTQSSPPPPTSNNVTLSWTAPTRHSDGRSISPGELVGYRIYYGTSPTNLNQRVDVNSASTLSYEITGLPGGATYYFAMTSRTATEESDRTNLVTRTF